MVTIESPSGDFLSIIGLGEPQGRRIRSGKFVRDKKRHDCLRFWKEDAHAGINAQIDSRKLEYKMASNDWHMQHDLWPGQEARHGCFCSMASEWITPPDLRSIALLLSKAIQSAEASGFRRCYAAKNSPLHRADCV